jgi:predicted glycoside hydrolase/deacetylase ChbG (UPF0249 family)
MYLEYPSAEKLLIIHGDDLAVAHSINQSTFAALDRRVLSAASVMVPCPWFMEVVAYATAHPDVDLGIHLTLTSEWKYYRWGPVATKAVVSSLLDPTGCFWADGQLATSHVNPVEVEIEIRAQIHRALLAGIRPSHLDSHMSVLFRNPVLFGVFTKVAHDYALPFRVPRSLRDDPKTSSFLADTDLTLNKILQANAYIRPEHWKQSYLRALRSLEPGLSELIVHLGYDNSELKGITMDHPPWGSAWRQRDFDVLTSTEFTDALKQNDIHVVSWRDLSRPRLTALSGSNMEPPHIQARLPLLTHPANLRGVSKVPMRK